MFVLKERWPVNNQNYFRRETSEIDGLSQSIKKNLRIVLALAIIFGSWTFIIIGKYHPNNYSVKGSFSVIPALKTSYNEMTLSRAVQKYYGLLDSDVFREIVWDHVSGEKQADDELVLSVAEGSNLIHFEGLSKTPARAYAIANSAINNYKEMFDYGEETFLLNEFSKPTANKMSIVSNNAVSISLAISLLVICLGLLFITLYHIFNDKIYTIAQAQDKINGKLLGSIPLQNKGKENNLMITKSTTAPKILKMYHKASLNIDYLLKEAGHKVLLVTSDRSGEGKSTTALNLALTLAKLKKRVLLLDLDLRNPNLYKYINATIEEDQEITTILKGGKGKTKSYFEKSIQHNADLGIDYLLGSIKNFEEFTGLSKGLDYLIEQLRDEYDYIIIDTSPMGIIKDTFIQASFVDDVLIVVRQDQSQVSEVNEIINDLKLSSIPLLGYILNGINSKFDGMNQGE